MGKISIKTVAPNTKVQVEINTELYNSLKNVLYVLAENTGNEKSLEAITNLLDKKEPTSKEEYAIRTLFVLIERCNQAFLESGNIKETFIEQSELMEDKDFKNMADSLKDKIQQYLQ